MNFNASGVFLAARLVHSARFCFFPLAKGSKCLLGDLYLNAFDRFLLGFSCTFLAFRCRFSGNGTFQFTDAGLYRTRFKGSLTFPECWRDVALRADVFFCKCLAESANYEHLQVHRALSQTGTCRLLPLADWPKLRTLLLGRHAIEPLHDEIASAFVVRADADGQVAALQLGRKVHVRGFDASEIRAAAMPNAPFTNGPYPVEGWLALLSLERSLPSIKSGEGTSEGIWSEGGPVLAPAAAETAATAAPEAAAQRAAAAGVAEE